MSIECHLLSTFGLDGRQFFFKIIDVYNMQYIETLSFDSFLKS